MSPKATHGRPLQPDLEGDTAQPPDDPELVSSSVGVVADVLVAAPETKQ